MTYSPTAFQATHLWQRVCEKLGLTKGLVATGGSATSIQDTKLSDEYQDYSDFQSAYAFVRHDSAGAGAAPEGEVQLVTAFAAGATPTLTVDTYSAAVAAGDIITLIRGSVLPLNDLKRICSLALQELGNIPNPNTSLTTAASQTQYTIPSGVPWNRVVDVQLPRFTDDSNDMQYYSVPFKLVPPSSVGTVDATFEIQQPDSNLTIRLIWVGQHPDIFDYDDDISTVIHPDLAVAAAALECALWKADQFKDKIQMLQSRKNEAAQLYPLPKFIKSMGGFPTWQNDKRYSRYSREELA